MDDRRKTTSGKASWGRLERGDRSWSAALGDALALQDRDDDLTHGFHTYPAGLHPVTARKIVELHPESSVGDVFCGGGTALVEAMRAGRRAAGADLSPVAVGVARARTSLADEDRLTRMRSAARGITERARRWREPPPQAVLRRIEDWYEPAVILELEGLHAGIAEAPADVRHLLEVAFSSILVKVSHRRSDTSLERVQTARPSGTTAILFHKKVRELGRRLADLRAAVPIDTPPADVQRRDARAAWRGPAVDLMLTSPPYPGVYDYLGIQDLRSAWLGLPLDLTREIASRESWNADPERARDLWLSDTHDWMVRTTEALSPRGVLVIVVGDGRAPGGPMDTLAPTIDVAREVGLRFSAGASLARPDSGRTPEWSGRPAVRWEHVLRFERRG